MTFIDNARSRSAPLQKPVCVCALCVCCQYVCVGTLFVNKRQQLPVTRGIVVAHSEQFTGQSAHWEQAAAVQRVLCPLVFPHGHVTIYFLYFLAGFIYKVPLKSQSCGSS